MQARPAARTRCAPDHTALSGSHRSPCHDLRPFPVGPFPRTQEVRSPGMPAARLPGNSTYDNPRQGRTPDTGGCLVFLTSLTRRPGRLVPCWSRPGPCVRKNAREPPAMAGGDLPGVPGDKQPPTPGCRGAPFGYFPNLVKYQGGAGASGDTRHLAATTTSPSGWRTCATPCFGSAESTWRLRLRHLPACQRGRAGVFSRPPCCRSHAPAASAWYVAGPEDEIELPGPVSVARLVHRGSAAAFGSGWS